MMVLVMTQGARTQARNDIEEAEERTLPEGDKDGIKNERYLSRGLRMNRDLPDEHEG